MNDYLEDLKKRIDKADQYAHHIDTIDSNNIFVTNKNKTNIYRYILWIFATLLISIAVISFITQTFLNVFLGVNMNNVDKNIIATTTVQKPEDVLKDFYIRADLTKDVFEEKTKILTIGNDEVINTATNTNKIKKPLPIWDENHIKKYTLNNKYLPKLVSKAYLIADLETGETILEKDKKNIYPIASVTKLMTGLVAKENMDLQKQAIVSRDASKTYGAQGGLGLGEKILLADLLIPLLMESSNDAAEVFADEYGHAEFLYNMNLKAKEIGMLNTYYNDPSGLDPKNTSNTIDLLKLLQYIYLNERSLYDTTRVKQFSLKNHTWKNNNKLLPVQGFFGGKNGFTSIAKQTTATIFEVPLAKGGVRKIAILILNSNDKNGDVQRILNFLKKGVEFNIN